MRDHSAITYIKCVLSPGGLCSVLTTPPQRCDRNGGEALEQAPQGGGHGPKAESVQEESG